MLVQLKGLNRLNNLVQGFKPSFKGFLRVCHVWVRVLLSR